MKGKQIKNAYLDKKFNTELKRKTDWFNIHDALK